MSRNARNSSNGRIPLRRRIFPAFTISVLALTLVAVEAPAAPAASQTAKTADRTTAAAAEALARLRGSAAAPAEARLAVETRAYNFVRAAGGVLFAGERSAPPEARALEFLQAHGAVVGMSEAERQSLGAAKSDAAALRAVRVETDSIGMTHVRFDQFYRGLPVFGAQVVVHMDARGVTAVNGTFVPKVSVPTTPSIPAARAAEIAVDTVRNRTGATGLAAAGAELSVYRTGLLEGYYGENRLAYGVVVEGPRTKEQVWVDATTGAVLDRIPLRHEAKYRIVYSPTYEPAAPDLFVLRREGDPPTNVPQADKLYDFSGEVYDLYRNGFGRDSYDGAGATMRTVYLVNEVCPNAYWDGASTNYCPLFDEDDVVAHEWAHAYTQHTHGLIYSYQSGALNESYSDIFGEALDLTNGRDGDGGSNNDAPAPAGQRWIVGEDVLGLGPLRDMWDPASLGDPDRVTSSSYHCSSGDGGGVHTNSGVPNHAFAMLVDGKTFNGQTVEGIGLVKALQIYFRAMAVYQVPSTNFAAHADALEAAASDLRLAGLDLPDFRTGEPSGETITEDDVEQVRRAMLAVEMRTPPAHCDFRPLLAPGAPEPCAGAGTIFSEDFEGGAGAWALASEGLLPEWPDRNWTVDASLPGGRAGSAAYASNPPLGDPESGTCAAGGDYSGRFTITSPAVELPADAGELRLGFDHYVATEAGYDGGQLRVSVNGGAFALVPQESYLFNAPNGPLAGPPPGDNNTNPRAGELAWHGTDQGSLAGSWGTTVVDLSGIAGAGDRVQVQFELSQDGCNGVDGWYVDDVRLYDCPPLGAPVLSVGDDYEGPDTDGAYTLTWQRPEGAAGPDTLQESTVACAPPFADDAEQPLVAGANARWSGSPQWVSLVDPGTGSLAYYIPNLTTQDESLTTADAVALPAGATSTLRFDTRQHLENGYDVGRVEVSLDGGASFVEVAAYTGPAGIDPATSSFVGRRTVDLTPFAGRSILLRFRLTSDLYNENAPGGWFVDNIAVDSVGWSDVAAVDGTSLRLEGRASGTYCYRVRTSYEVDGALVEGPFSNVVTVLVDGTAPVARPDLVVTGIQASSERVRQGEKVTVTATVANRGNADAGASATEILLDGSQSLGVVETPPVAAGGSTTVSVFWDTRSVKGEHTIRATADSAGAVAESDETNNAGTLTVTVQGNKVQNGSFEQSGSGSAPDGWTGSSTGAGTTSWGDGGADGSKGASARGNGRSALLYGSPAWTSAPIAVVPGESLSLAVSVRSLGASSAPTAGLVYLGAAGQLLQTVTLLTAPVTTSGFARLEQLVTIPAGVAQVRVRLVAFAPTDLATAGTVTFDDVGLYEETPAAAAASAARWPAPGRLFARALAAPARPRRV